MTSIAPFEPMPPYAPGADYARRSDAADPLAGLRDRFLPPADGVDGAPTIYLCGNSLGLQPRRARELLAEELDDWQALAVRGHHEARRPWIPYVHDQLAPLLARVVGAAPGEAVAMNSLTVNLHLMLVSFYRPTATRHKLLIEHPAFPSDRYAVASQLRYHGYDPGEALIEIGPRPGEATIRAEDLAETIERHGEQIAVMLLSGVQYYSGQLFDIAGLTRLAHEKGCTVGWDLAHAAGNVPLALHAWDVDFAVWCHYKYLNGGPGAPAGCFVHDRHGKGWDGPRFCGWWGNDPQTRFRMEPELSPAPGVEGWQLSTPPILALAPVLASLEMFDEVGLEALRDKSLRLTGYLEYLLKESSPRLSGAVEVLTPADPAQRGCQLSLRLVGEDRRRREIFDGLAAHGVVCDWREPDVVRIAPAPLYNGYGEVFRFVEILESLV